MSTSSTQHRRARRRWLVAGGTVTAVATTGGLLLTGLVGPGSRPAAAEPGLHQFGSCQAVDDWYTENLLPHVTAGGIDTSDGGGFVLRDGPLVDRGVTSTAPEAAAPAEAAQAGEADAVGVGDTGTNLQEAGVDEPDVAKTSGGRMYTVVGPDLVVLDVGGPAPVELGRARLPGQVTGEAELLLTGNRVVVLSSGWLPGTGQDGSGTAQAAPMEPGSSVDIARPPGRGTTVTTVVDVSAPAAPAVVHTDEVEGDYLSARLTGTTVRVVTTSTPHYDFPTPAQESTDAESTNKQHLRGLTAGDFLPGTVVTAADGTRTVQPRTDCSTVARPQEWSGAGVITVRTLDPSAGRPVVDEDLVVADGDLVYASADRLYVGTVEYRWNTWNAGGDSTTQLHGFDTSAADATGYLASGRISGTVPGRWALSARDGMLRVASTRPEHHSLTRGRVPSQSGITVLAERGGDLVAVGSVHGLGVDEQIHAVRWFDDTAYLVTFRQTDPLYAVDLSDPADPRVTGELKIPGFSSYLHPVGGHRLLGVGQDADPLTGRTGAAQVSLFDVSDPATPNRVGLWQDTDQAWGSRSTVADDSRQFSYLPDEHTALVPLVGEGTALVALRVDEAALSPTGRLELGDAWSPDVQVLRRAMSLGDGRVVLIADGTGRTLTTARATTLETSGSLTLPLP